MPGSITTGETWRPLPQTGEPLPRAQSAFAWSGRELIVLWGLPNSEAEPLRDGAAYDPVARVWRSLAVPPPRHRATAIASAGGMFVFAGARVDDGDDGRAWVMGEKDVWRPATAAGAPAARRGRLALAGNEVIVWTGEDGGAAYDSIADRWRPLSSTDRPTPSIDHELGSDGHALVVWGVDEDGELVAGGALYEATLDRWTRIDPPPGDADAMASGKPLLTARHLFVTGCDRDAAELIVWMYDRERAEWTRGSVLERLVESHHACCWTGSEIVLLAGVGKDYQPTRNVLAFAPRTQTWRALPPIPWREPRLEPAWAWTGRSLVVWSGMEGERSMPGGFELEMS